MCAVVSGAPLTPSVELDRDLWVYHYVGVDSRMLMWESVHVSPIVARASTFCVFCWHRLFYEKVAAWRGSVLGNIVTSGSDLGRFRHARPYVHRMA